MARSFRNTGTYRLRVLPTRGYQHADIDPGEEQALVATMGGLRSQLRRRLGPGKTRYSTEALKDPPDEVTDA